MTRVIAGSAKGRLLKTPRGLRVRPTSAKVREALFSILGGGAVADAAVLDLYSGSGALGIEALSRGALRCTFVDSDGRSLSCVRHNLERLALLDRAQLLKRRIPARLSDVRDGPYDLIFSDPPYDDDVLEALAHRLGDSQLVSAESIWAHELATRLLPDPAPEPDGWQIITARRYGDTAILVMTPDSPPTPERSRKP